MSEANVSVAVAAIVSAFRAGADLTGRLRVKKWRRSSTAQRHDEDEKKKLQASLETAQSQIASRFGDDIKKFGAIVQVGDVTARDQLLYVAVVVQTEILMSLQMATNYDSAIIDFKTLYDASITCRTNTFDALADLKRRVMLKNPLLRTFESSPNSPSGGASLSAQTMRSPDPSTVLENHLPKAVIGVDAGVSSNEEKTGLARYFSTRRKDSVTSITTNRSPVYPGSEKLTTHPALRVSPPGREEEEPKVIMKDIDEIIAAYQGLRVDGDRADTLASLTGYEEPSKRDTLAVLHGGMGYNRDTIDLHRDALHLLKDLPQTGDHENQEYPAYNHNILNESDDRRLSEWIEQPAPAPGSLRWTRNSASSSVYSDHTVCSEPPPLSRADSVSSGESPQSPFPSNIDSIRESAQHASSVYSVASYWLKDRVFSTNSSLVSSTRTESLPPAPLTQLPRPISPLPNQATLPALQPPTPTTTNGSRWATSRNLHLPHAQQHGLLSRPDPRQLHPIMPTNVMPKTPTTTTNVVFTAQEKMMDGRPCKGNKYWGFCKGAWGTREEVKKGLNLENRPVSVYNTAQIWQCKHCCFEGGSFAVPHPTKKNKKEIVVDPTIYTSAVGIRYRWIFLAKSHVKKKNISSDTSRPLAMVNKNSADDSDCSFGCVVCSVEGNVTGIYGNVETLMNHIYVEHLRSGNMRELTLARSKCIMGRTAGPEEEWDINVPMGGATVF